jgi:hypothetical protein
LWGLLLATAPRPPAAAQTSSAAVPETSLGIAALLARRTFIGAEGGLDRRAGQGRLALAAAAGLEGGVPAARLEARAQFLLLPPARTATGWYGGLGIAAAEAASRHGAVYLTVALGVETAVWHTRGLYAEVGFGGGLRVGAGVRWRRVPAWWP